MLLDKEERINDFGVKYEVHIPKENKEEVEERIEMLKEDLEFLDYKPDVEREFDLEKGIFPTKKTTHLVSERMIQEFKRLGIDVKNNEEVLKIIKEQIVLEANARDSIMEELKKLGD